MSLILENNRPSLIRHRGSKEGKEQLRARACLHGGNLLLDKDRKKTGTDPANPPVVVLNYKGQRVGVRNPKKTHQNHT